jgi:HK97 gp10 family phage protein
VKVGIRVTGADELIREMRRYGDRANEVMDGALQKAAIDTRNEAVAAIQRGPKTGSVYPAVRGRRGSAHQASAPGEPPATDTGTLVRSVRWVEAPAAREWRVGTAVQYGAYLEFGTSRMEARPWLFPAVQEAIPVLRKRLVDGMERLARGR